MKTKTSLLAALIAIASSASLTAQVYSLNVVGYINLTIPNGYSLICNQLTLSNNTLNAVLPNVPPDSLVLTFANNDYKVDVFDGSAWLDNNTAEPSTTTLPPGKGFFFNNPGAQMTLTFIGDVVQGSNNIALPNGYTLVGNPVPQAIPLTAANGFPQIPDMLYLTFANNDYDTLVNDGSGWLDNDTAEPAVAQPAIGQGFFVNNPLQTVANWSRTFNVN
jgi:hypothetical protein